MSDGRRAVAGVYGDWICMSMSDQWRAYCEAAEEIERLRSALTAIAEDNPNQVRTPTMLATIARQALAGAGGTDD